MRDTVSCLMHGSLAVMTVKYGWENKGMPDAYQG